MKLLSHSLPIKKCLSFIFEHEARWSRKPLHSNCVCSKYTTKIKFWHPTVFQHVFWQFSIDFSGTTKKCLIWKPWFVIRWNQKNLGRGSNKKMEICNVHINSAKNAVKIPQNTAKPLQNRHENARKMRKNVAKTH